MSKRSYYRRILIMILVASIIYTGHETYEYITDAIPDRINIKADSNEMYELDIPAAASVVSADSSVSVINNNLCVKTNEKGKYKVNVKLFGIFNFKSIDINVIENMKVIPCGYPVGIYLETDGVMVISTGEVVGMNGNVTNPAENKILSGDYITSLNGISVNSKSQLSFLINKYGDSEIIFGLNRNGKNTKVKVKPVETGIMEYKAGIWVRDDTQGIGTLTFITENNKFGALGHGISDVDTGELLESDKGVLYEADVWGIKKGENGRPGGLCGVIQYEEDSILGEINANTNQGIFGNINSKIYDDIGLESVDICLKQNVKKGKAKIRCYVENTFKDYDIEIISVDKNSSNGNKGLVIQVTDPKLLRITNGIVQGMSGSPILQDNKIVGAVTHVFINDPTKGYGIFIEDMLASDM